MNIIPRDGATARQIASEVVARSTRFRVSMAVGIHADGRVQITPACKSEGERLLASDACIGVFTAAADRAELIEVLRDRIFAVLKQRLRATREAA